MAEGRTRKGKRDAGPKAVNWGMNYVPPCRACGVELVAMMTREGPDITCKCTHPELRKHANQCHWEMPYSPAVEAERDRLDRTYWHGTPLREQEARDRLNKLIRKTIEEDIPQVRGQLDAAMEYSLEKERKAKLKSQAAQPEAKKQAAAKKAVKGSKKYDARGDEGSS